MRQNLLLIALLIVSFNFNLAPVIADEAGFDDSSFDSNGVQIHYTTAGSDSGEAVVLIHGFAGSINPQWTQVIPALAANYKVIAMDCRGHGASGKPHDPKKYGVEMVNDVARLLDHLKIEKAHIVGYSQRVRSIVLGGGGLERNRDALVAELADSLEKGKGFGPIILALTRKDQPKPTPEMIRQIDLIGLAMNDAKAIAAAARGSVSADGGLQLSDKQIETVRAPVLALIGASDPVREEVDELHKLLPKLKVVVIENSDHMSAWMRPEFLKNLRQFLDDNRQSQSH
jgi:pimeloyl-ACP methyl ester carboxylesterase